MEECDCGEPRDWTIVLVFAGFIGVIGLLVWMAYEYSK